MRRPPGPGVLLSSLANLIAVIACVMLDFGRAEQAQAGVGYSGYLEVVPL
ncbi:hypothetical protein ACWD3J_49115 [Streptomyces sp. NPDC002755]